MPSYIQVASHMRKGEQSACENTVCR